VQQSNNTLNNNLKSNVRDYKITSNVYVYKSTSRDENTSGTSILSLFRDFNTKFTKDKDSRLQSFINDSRKEENLPPRTRHQIRHKRHKLRENMLQPNYKCFQKDGNKNYTNKSCHLYKNVTSFPDIDNNLLTKTSKIVGNISSNHIEKGSLKVEKYIEKDSSMKKPIKEEIEFIPKIPIFRILKEQILKRTLKPERKFSNDLFANTAASEEIPGEIPIYRLQSSKLFTEVEKLRSYNEELLNQIGTFVSLTKNGKSRRHFGLPIPNMRIKSFRDQIFDTKIQTYDETDSSNLNSKSVNTNIILFGQINENLARQIRNCGSYMSVDLLKNYNLDQLLKSNYQKRALIIYINVRQVSNESYEISVESIKTILDRAMAVYKGISMFNLYPYEEQFLNETKDISQNKGKRILLDMNDEVFDYCSQSYPDCQVKNSLDSTLWGLHQMYKEDKTLDFYNPDIFERQFCFSSNVCKPKTQTSFSKEKSIDSPYKQLKELSNVLCMSPRHRIVEFVLNAPLSLEDVYKSHKELFITRIDGRKKRISAQTGLVLQDILPKDLKMYDKNRPPKYEGQPTVVYFHVTVLSVDSINEESMTYVADIFLAQSWRDHRLRLPENMTEEYRILDVEWLHNIWRPDCFFKNAKQVTFHEMSVPNHYLWLYHDKTLLYMAKSHTCRRGSRASKEKRFILNLGDQENIHI
ncbi:Gamma-aminobutyric acid receptor subunit beta-4, partial [Armadillidium nasatum]